MTQEEKDLLLQDLCARLPYEVKMNHIADDSVDPETLIGIAKDMITLQSLGGYSCVDVEHYRPYLFPISSMTEEQRKECKSLMIRDSSGILYHTIESFDYLYKNHIDVRKLIPKGLANDATGLNIY